MSQQISAKKQQELQLQYSTYKNNLQQLAQKVGDVEQEAEEHKYAFDASRNLRLLYRKCPSVPEIRDLTAKVLCLPLFATRLVLETLNPLPEDRKCFRMINGVLVERTVKDVIPVLKTNSDGLKKVLEELLKQYKKQQDDMEKWKKKNHIQVVQQ